jgi:HSP20 family protein
MRRQCNESQSCAGSNRAAHGRCTIGCQGGSPFPFVTNHERNRDMNELRLLDPFLRDPFDDTIRSLMRPWRVGVVDGAPRMRIDLSEQDDSYLVKADIPGVRKDDIDVRIDGSLVTLSDQTKSEKEETEDGRMLFKERQEGYASRSFTLDCPVDEAKADARYEDGILTLKLPKKAAGSTKRLSIQ